jgi:type I restriction enzyme S subunit
MYWLWYAFELGKLYYGRGNKTTIPNLSKSRLGELLLPQPPLDEQESIVLLLSSLQRSADLHETIARDRRELQQAMTARIMSAQTTVLNIDLSSLKRLNGGGTS